MLATALLKNVSTGRYHPITFRLAPLPGGKQIDGLDRWRSIGHHTEGFASQKDAEAWIASNSVDLFKVGIVLEWDGKEIPATSIMGDPTRPESFIALS